MSDSMTAVVLARSLQVTSAPHAAFGVLRLGVEDEARARIELGEALGITLPDRPNTTAGSRPRVLWTAPRAWAVIDADATRLKAMQAAFGDRLCHYADLTDGRAGFRVMGRDAAQLLASECPLDLSEAAFGPDRCAQSLFAGAPVLIDNRPGEDGFRLYVDASLAPHLGQWLKTAAETLT